MTRRLCIITLVCMSQYLFAQGFLPEKEIKYKPDDWISYAMTRNMTSITLSETHAYFASSGGILPYNIYRESWDRPFTESDGLASNDVEIVAYDWETGFLWCVNRKAVSYFTPGPDEWRNMSFESLGIRSAYDLGMGKTAVWVAGANQLIRIDRSTGFQTNENDGAEVADQVEWSRRANGKTEIDLLDYFLPYGYFYKPDRHCFQDVQLREYPVRSLKKDRFFHLFVSSEGLGAGFGSLHTLRINFKSYGPYTPDVRAMAWDGDTGMWLGGHSNSYETGGITCWNMEQDEWQYFQAAFLSGMRSDQVNAITVDTADVWLGTEDGLARYHRKNDLWRTFTTSNNLWGNQVLSLALDGPDLWIGTDNGLNRMGVSDGVIRRETHPQMNLRRIYWIEPDGDFVWVGSDWGALLYQKSTAEWQTVSGYPSIHETVVTAISAWDGQVWFGTDDGVEMYDHATGEWRGFPDIHYEIGHVLSMMADHAVVWVGTTNGLLKYVKDEDRWHRYTTEDGLLHNAVQRILPDGDYIWLATPGGITRFYWNAPYRID